MAAHNEIHLENYIVQRLVKDCGWKEGKPEDYDKAVEVLGNKS